MKNLSPLLALSLATLSLASVVFAAPAEQVYFGNLHSHTSYSDGEGTPREAYTYARDVAGVDFLALTEHNHLEAIGSDGIGIAKTPTLYTGPGAESLIPVANEFTQNGHFVALYGQEFSTMSKGNHVNIFDIGQLITSENGRFDQLLDFLKANPDSTGQPPVVMLNHPNNLKTIVPKEYGEDDFGDDAGWVKQMGAETSLMEITNRIGPPYNDPSKLAEDAFLKFLNLGFKVAPSANQDNHKKNWGTADNSRTGVIAPALTKADLLDALHKRHVYATEDKNLKVICKVNDHLCGDVISPLPPAGNLTINYDISDADEPAATYEIQVFHDSVGGPVATPLSTFTTPAGGGQGTLPAYAFDGTPQYLFLKITQISTDGTRDRAWTAPVWLENAG